MQVESKLIITCFGSFFRGVTSQVEMRLVGEQRECSRRAVNSDGDLQCLLPFVFTKPPVDTRRCVLKSWNAGGFSAARRG